MENEYSQQELTQTVGHLYMDLARSQIVIRQLQQIIKDRDTLISQINNECGPTDSITS